MGFTHYWNTKPTITKEKWSNFQKAVETLLKDATILQYEYNNSKKPVISAEQIRFNGIEEDGHETFMIKRVDTPSKWDGGSTVFGFCKTARKPYDVYVTAVLLLAHIYLGDEITISSDGGVGDWQEGVAVINEKLNLDIKLENNPNAEYPDNITTAILTIG